MLYNLCKWNPNETAGEYQSTFSNSRHHSGRFTTRLVQRMLESGSIHSVGGLGRPRHHLTNDESDNLAYFFRQDEDK